MNKFLILLIALLVAVALCACGSSGDASQPNADPTENNVTTQPDVTGSEVTEPTSGTEVTDPESTAGDVENTQPDATEPSNDAVTEPLDYGTTEPGGIFNTEPENTDPAVEQPSLTSHTIYQSSYMWYHSLSGDQQMEFINSFNSIEAFIAWHTAAFEAYQDSLIEYDGSSVIQ